MMVEQRSPGVTAFAGAVRSGFAARPPRLDPKYFYDPLGSSLFEAICRLPWYRITRSENLLLAAHAGALANRFAGEALSVVELGVGSGEKLLHVMEALSAQQSRGRIHLVDISAQALDQASQRLERFGWPVAVHRAAYEEGLEEALSSRPDGVRTLVLFLGSNIGNFDMAVAEAFLARVARALAPGDNLLLGVDLVKPESDLLVAYDDPLGVTAAFNRNLLVRMNRELDANFELDGFAHRAIWNATEQRVEMHLVSRRRQAVTIPAAGVEVGFDEGEYLWTESSYKYQPEQIVAMGTAAGCEVTDQWVEDEALFALTLFRIPNR